MPPKPAVKRSPHRKEIEEMILEGQSSRAISRWLKDRGENISHNAINNYRKNEFNVQAEAAEEYQEKKSRERKDKAVKKTVSDLESLDMIIGEGNQVKLRLNEIQPDGDTSQLDIEKVKIQAKTLGVRAVKVKHEILKDEPAPVVNLHINQNLMDNLLNREGNETQEP